MYLIYKTFSKKKIKKTNKKSEELKENKELNQNDNSLSFKNLLWYVLFLDKLKCRANVWAKMNNKTSELKMAITNFKDELDCVSILASIKELKYFIQVLESNNQEKMINVRSKAVLNKEITNSTTVKSSSQSKIGLMSKNINMLSNE